MNQRVGIKRLRQKSRGDRLGDIEVDELDSFEEFLDSRPEGLELNTHHGRTLDLKSFHEC